MIVGKLLAKDDAGRINLAQSLHDDDDRRFVVVHTGRQRLSE